VPSRCWLGGQGSAGTRPERGCKSGMAGGLPAAILLSPPLHLRTNRFFVQTMGSTSRLTIEYGNAGMWRGPERISNSVGLEHKGNQSPDQQRDGTSLNHKHRNGVVRLAGCPLLG